MITGGIINEWGSNARLGNGQWMIVEADESDGTFIKIPSQIGVVTNIDPEHLDYFKTVENMHREFETFYPQHSRSTASPSPASTIPWSPTCSSAWSCGATGAGS